MGHLGLLAGVVGIFLQQRFGSSGAVVLTPETGQVDYRLSQDQRRIEHLPFTLNLDSITTLKARGFRPTAAAWVSTGGPSSPVYPNHPLRLAGHKIVFLRTVPAGFPLELLIRVGADEFLLLYQQAVYIASSRLVSFGYEPATQRIGFQADREQVWLRIGESASLAGMSISLLDARFASQPGVVLLVSDTRFTPVIFSGFGLMLLGIALVLLARWRR
ncbi:MAG: hypothetical protein ABIK43_03615 [candidate division WOR-3 bacterium]